MSNRHANSRREAYGRRQKDLRARRLGDLSVDLDGPDGPGGWSRGGAWEPQAGMPPVPHVRDARDGSSAR